MSSGDPPTLFPFENLTYLAQHPASLHYSRLLRGKNGPDIDPSDNTALEGDVVAKWEQPDDTSYVFTLKPNLKWQNIAPMNGRAMTATDILNTYEAFLAKSQNAAGWKAVVDTFEAPDEKTVKITLKTPFAPFLVSHASSTEALWLIPVEIIDNDQVKTQPVGSGPWIFDDYETGVAMRWLKNPDFHDIADFPHYDLIDCRMSIDSGQRQRNVVRSSAFVPEVQYIDLSSTSNAVASIDWDAHDRPLCSQLATPHESTLPTPDISSSRTVTRREKNGTDEHVIYRANSYTRQHECNQRSTCGQKRGFGASTDQEGWTLSPRMCSRASATA